MRRTTTNLLLGLALAAFPAGSAISAQVNPATVKNQAQSGVNQAQQQSGQGQGQTQGQPPAKQSAPTQNSTSKTKTPPKNTTQPAKQTASGQNNPPAKQAAATASKTPATNSAKTPAPPAKGTAAQTTPSKNATTAPPKSAGAAPPSKQAPPKPVAKAPAKAPAPAPAKEEKSEPPVVRRDPFVTLVSKRQGGEGENVHLPPGKAGLQVGTLVLQGIVSGPNGVIAVVANPQKSVYFLHAGDEIYDGRVDRIDMDGVTFTQVGKDAFGKPLERQVVRKLNPSSGEQP